MDTLTVTLTNKRLIDGFIIAANRAGMDPEAFALELMARQGHRYADDYQVGVITSAAFIARFTPAEFGAVLAAAAEPTKNGSAVASLVNELTNTAMLALDDARLQPGLELLVNLGILTPERAAGLSSYERPTISPQSGGESTDEDV